MRLARTQESFTGRRRPILPPMGEIVPKVPPNHVRATISPRLRPTVIGPEKFDGLFWGSAVAIAEAGHVRKNGLWSEIAT
jgi:hypothetical protein